jgi:hypothetical protein
MPDSLQATHPNRTALAVRADPHSTQELSIAVLQHFPASVNRFAPATCGTRFALNPHMC